MGLPACPNGMCQRGIGQQARAPLTRVIWNTCQWGTIHRYFPPVVVQNQVFSDFPNVAVNSQHLRTDGVAPAAGARFTTPTGGARFTTPTAGARFTTPTGEARVIIPTGEAGFTTPTGEARVIIPTGEARFTTPTAGARFTTPTGGARFTTPTGGARPTTPTGGARPITPTGGARFPQCCWREYLCTRTPAAYSESTVSTRRSDQPDHGQQKPRSSAAL